MTEPYTIEDAVQDAINELSSWLLDNTEKVFEEEGVIDGVRSRLQEALDSARKGDKEVCDD